MSMGLSQSTDLTLTTAAVQLQQMRRVLQMNVLQCQHQELLDFLEQEFEENPCLEMQENLLDPETAVSRKENRDDGEAERFDRLDSMSDEISYYQEEYSRPSRSVQEEMSDRHQEFLENISESTRSLPEFLQEQLPFLSLTPRQRDDVDRIIFSLDDRGFLSTPLEDLFGCDSESLARGKAALMVVQSLEPGGVGARDWKECLLIQIRAMQKEALRQKEIQTRNASLNEFGDEDLSELEYDAEEEDPDAILEKCGAMQCLLTRYSRELETNSIPRIASGMGISAEEVYVLLKRIGQLNFNPGRDFSPREQTVRPDLFCVQDDDGNWNVTLDESGLPQFTVNLSWGKDCATEEEREFFQRKKNAAQWLMEAIQNRKQTLLDVGNALIHHQSEFLKNGMKAMRPLTEKQVADEIGKHSSTVSRAIRGKWIQTPHGLFPLSAFFSSSVAAPQSQPQISSDFDGSAPASPSGEEALSQEAVLHQMRELIDQEDKTEPYSDDQLASMLKIARTTVNKYRKKLNIPSSRQRKIYGSR